MSAGYFDLVTAEGRLMTWRDYLDAYRDGYRDGIDHGRRQADEEHAALHRAAVAVVHRAATMPVRDHAADERRAAASATYWAERRGESC